MRMPAKYIKTIICLANSRKIGGRSVAGKELDAGKPGAWVRPVSPRPEGTLSDEDVRLDNGKEPQLLDVISIPMVEARPCSYQTENHLIDVGCSWTKEREASWSDLQAALDTVSGPLWDNSSSSYNGLNDRVEEAAATYLGGSLRLIEVPDLTMLVAVEGANIGNAHRKVRGRFTLNGATYLLAVTDTVIERKYLAGPDGESRLGPAVMCIGLREPYRGYAYKLVAGVFPKR